MPGRRAAVLVEQPPWPFSFRAGPCGWSSSGAALELAGVAVKPKPCTSCAVQGRDRAGLARTGISGAVGPLPGAAASGRLGGGWKESGRRLQGCCWPCWQCDSVGWAPFAQPLPQCWQQPQPMCWSSKEGLGDVCGVGTSCPYSGAG